MNPDAEGEPVRTAPQRRADAIVDIFRWYLEHRSNPPSTRHRPHLGAIIGIDDLVGDGPGVTVDGQVLAAQTIQRWACCGIAFNHESPRRGHEFLTRKVSRGVAAIKLGTASELVLGSLEPRRDWGFAGDYVRAMWQMLQLDRPGDYVIASGRDHSLADFVSLAFAHAGLDWTDHVRHDVELHPASDIQLLVGEASKARAAFGWEPSTSLEEVIAMMVDADVDAATRYPK